MNTNFFSNKKLLFFLFKSCDIFLRAVVGLIIPIIMGVGFYSSFVIAVSTIGLISVCTRLGLEYKIFYEDIRIRTNSFTSILILDPF